MPDQEKPSVLRGVQPDASVRACMGTWLEILECCEQPPPMTENQLKSMLHYEVNSSEPRLTVINRIHGRLCRMRAQRERQELLTYVGVEN